MSVTEVKITASTADTTSYASSAFTPTVGLLIVCFVTASTTVAASTLVDSLGGTYAKVTSFLTNSSADTGWDCTGDPAEGATINAFEVSGVSGTGSSAVRGKGTVANQAGGGTPAVTLDAGAALTGNPVLGLVQSAAGANNWMTPPSGFTEARDVASTVPNRGTETVFIDSGFTSATVTWGATCATAFGAAAIELTRGGSTTNKTLTTTALVLGATALKQVSKTLVP